MRVRLYLTFLFCFLPVTAFCFDHSHQKFNQILHSSLHVVNKQALVDYKGIQSNPIPLKEYLSDISSVKENEFRSFTETEQMAYLINAYNAYTIQLILDHYPVSSIKDIGTFWQSPWKKKFFTLFGKPTSLDEIEQEMLRKNYREARIHFALNCASISCPSLYPEAFTATKLEQQLKTTARNFLMNTERNSIDTEEKVLFLSKIFDWYEEDFEKASGSVVQFISPYILNDPTLQKQIAKKTFSIKYLSYDWSLNDFP